MNGVVLDSDDSEFVEVDPTGRYGRYNEILGKGSSKTVYRGFDEYEGIEVAWNQVKLNDFLRSREDFERLYCEIHLLKTLKHKNIMKFSTYWVDMANRNLNFVTELFTSGTLRQYRLKHKRVNIRAIKHWCRQILQGLLYLHSHDPPVIHRDLKCNNIFINGNQGEVKIGDLGLAAILQKSRAALCVGTPEFMAPEVYEEEYNELVDIYSFGMCILEMVTFEYPYSECSLPAEIYKKVISGKKPDALYKVKDPEVRRFVEKCLAIASDRLSAWELLNDPFLQTDDCGYYLRSLGEYDELGQRVLSAYHSANSSVVNGYNNFLLAYEQENDLDCQSDECEANEVDLFGDQYDEHLENVDITIRGRRTEDDRIFLRLRISDEEGPARNIHFPFDIETDTALSVAAEMVAELDIQDQDVTKIAEMIDNQIASLVPEWRCVADGCSDHVLHGRFEEVAVDQFEEVAEQSVTEGAPMMCSSQSNSGYYADIWAQINHDNGHFGDNVERARTDQQNTSRNPPSGLMEDYDDEIRQELRWIKAKYEMEIREFSDQLHRATSLPVDATNM